MLCLYERRIVRERPEMGFIETDDGHSATSATIVWIGIARGEPVLA